PRAAREHRLGLLLLARGLLVGVRAEHPACGAACRDDPFEGGPVDGLVPCGLRLGQQAPDHVGGGLGALGGRGARREREADGERDQPETEAVHAGPPAPGTATWSRASARAPRTSALGPSSPATTSTGPATLRIARDSIAERTGSRSSSPAWAS